MFTALQRKKRLASHFRRVEGQDSGVPTGRRCLTEPFDGRQEVAEPADVDGGPDLAEADSSIGEAGVRRDSGCRRNDRGRRRRRSCVSSRERGLLHCVELRGIGKRTAAGERLWRRRSGEVRIDPVGGLGSGHSEELAWRSHCASMTVRLGCRREKQNSPIEVP